MDSIIQTIKNLIHNETEEEGCFSMWFSSTTGVPVDVLELERYPGFPDEMYELWKCSDTTTLFQELYYGQWGLIIHDPKWCVMQTQFFNSAFPGNLDVDDYVIGEFLGDTDKLVMSGSPMSTQRILVATPLDPKSEWAIVGDNLKEFLNRFIASGGSKYWE